MKSAIGPSRPRRSSTGRCGTSCLGSTSSPRLPEHGRRARAIASPMNARPSTRAPDSGERTRLDRAAVGRDPARRDAQSRQQRGDVKVRGRGSHYARLLAPDLTASVARRRRTLARRRPLRDLPAAAALMSPPRSPRRRRAGSRCSTARRRARRAGAARAGDAREHRRGDGAAVVLAGRRLVDHHRDDEPRIRHRCEADERRDVLVRVVAAFELVRGAGLAGHAIAANLRLRRGAAGWAASSSMRRTARAVSGLITDVLRPSPVVLNSVTGFSSPSVAKIV